MSTELPLNAIRYADHLKIVDDARKEERERCNQIVRAAWGANVTIDTLDANQPMRGIPEAVWVLSRETYYQVRNLQGEPADAKITVIGNAIISALEAVKATAEPQLSEAQQQAQAALDKVMNCRFTNFDAGAVIHWVERGMYQVKPTPPTPTEVGAAIVPSPALEANQNNGDRTDG